MSGLSRKDCVPCRAGAPALTEKEIKAYLPEIDVTWRVEAGKRLEREVRMKNFQEALALVNKIGVVAEEQGHHPNMGVHNWNKVKLELYTHKIGGLHENDFILAAKIDNLIEADG